MQGNLHLLEIQKLMTLSEVQELYLTPLMSQLSVPVHHKETPVYHQQLLKQAMICRQLSAPEVEDGTIYLGLLILKNLEIYLEEVYIS